MRAFVGTARTFPEDAQPHPEDLTPLVYAEDMAEARVVLEEDLRRRGSTYAHLSADDWDLSDVTEMPTSSRAYLL